jgi:hypothetical protein
MTQPTQEQIDAMRKVALIIDGEVVDIIYTDDRFASILLSNPLGIDVTERLPSESILVGYQYNSQSDTFSE